MEQPESDFQEDLGMGGKIKNWLQDNIRIVISVLIVVAIAGGIYSYSKRSDQLSLEEELLEETAKEETVSPESGSAVNVVGDKEEAEQTAKPTPATTAKGEKPEEVKLNGEGAQTEVISSEETQEAFVQTAVRGDGTTKLARRALKSYLEKNNDSSLTAEHKIFIEDYLRKNIQHPQKVVVGEKVSFSKSLIAEAIEKAKNLNPKQLDNLKKYSSRVVW